jgi:PAS domain S-box-containing protein
MVKKNRPAEKETVGPGAVTAGSKPLKEALEHSEERYRAILEQMYDVYYEVDLAGNFTFLNEASCRKLGYSREELIGKSYRLTVPEDDAAKLFAASKAVFNSGEPDRCYSHSILRKDGGVILAESFIGLRRNRQGEIIGFRTVSRNVTESKRAESAQKIQHALSVELSQVSDLNQAMRLCLVAAIEISGMDSGGIYIVDPDTGAIDLTCSIGVSREFIGGSSHYAKSSANASLIMAGKPVYANYSQISLSVSKEQKSEGLKAMAVVPVSSRNGVVACLNIGSHSVEDMPVSSRNAIETIASQIGGSIDRLRAREALGKSEEKFRLLVENSHDIIYTLTADGVFTFVSPAWTTLLGHPVNQVAGQPFQQFVHPDDVPACMVWLQKVIETGQRQEGIEYRVRHIDGSWYWHTSSAVPLSDKTGTVVGFEGTARDISGNKRLEEEQQRVAKLESVGLLAGGIAHDFNNILTAILGNISLAGMEAEPGSELQTSLEQAEKASLRAKDLTKQLLTFSKGGAPVKKLASLTELLKDTAGFALRGSNVKCHFSIPADLWHAEIDAGQISQVIHNLVINAKQAMPNGGTIELMAENMALSKTQRLGKGLPVREGSYVRIAITDHGTGIPKDHIEKIFDPFFTTKQEGSGLGLTSSFSIARQHSGHISVESELGAGSTFYLYLPASREMAIAKQDKKGPTKAAGKARILVMDDEKGVREVAGRMLKHIGYKDIEFAADGTAAIKLYKAAMKCGNPFNVSILDLTIAGGMGGEESIKKLLKIDPGIKAIVSSGYADDPVIARYREYGFSGIVAKPYTLEELGKAVHDAIG